MTEERSFAWVLNLDAEFELARPRYTTPRLLQAQLDRYGAGARALLGPDDVLAKPGLCDGPLRMGRAWCPTPLAVARLRAAGVEPEPHPDAEVLRRVNHRRFAHSLGGGLPGQRWVASEPELTALLSVEPPPFARGWLLKRPLAFAGRGQQRISGPLEARQRAWITASLRDDGLVAEPWIQPLLEVSLHGFIDRTGRLTLGHPCIQDVDPGGVFRGVRQASDGELARDELDALASQGPRVAQALSAEGYFGPFGVDAYRYQAGFCALSEINARFTMGFAVGFPMQAHRLRV